MNFRNGGGTTPYIEPSTSERINTASTTNTMSPTMVHDTSTDQVTDLTTEDTNILNSATGKLTTTEEPLLPTSLKYIQTTTVDVLTSLPKLKSTTNSFQTTVYTNVAPTTISTESIDNMSTVSITKQPINIKHVTTSGGNVLGNKFHVLIPRKLFNPSINKLRSNLDSNQTSTHIKSSNNGSTKVVESLMTGGVIRLPLKTNSNFRFLFSSNPVVTGEVKQSSGVGVEVAVRRPVHRSVT